MFNPIENPNKALETNKYKYDGAYTLKKDVIVIPIEPKINVLLLPALSDNFPTNKAPVKIPAKTANDK